ncbi:transporter [Thermosipho sp. 1063]|uniref:queuosine precursor transporter n=1 Tax=unclassified Thermosipho (in: thermotogales) TaxID=2676525 RepID=UPI0009493701|nr:MULTISPECIES: queuosine precursor transporter [unclassified Thermosipho (in: thermotogales)]ANQ53093.1 transporter [Thermosipho sp. 1070]APT71542.1 transporter [Thermosipho sp. 1063]
MEKYYEKLITLSGIFTAVIIISNIIAGKLVNIGPFVITLSVLIYPLSFGISNIVFEIYGEKIAKKVIKIGFISSLILVIYSYIVILYPPASIFNKNNAYVAVFNSTPRIILASFFAYLSAQYTNVWAFNLPKRLFKINNVIFRNTFSMVITQLVDSIVFVLVSFLWTYDLNVLMNMVISQYIVKLILSSLNSPIINISIQRFKKDLAFEK